MHILDIILISFIGLGALIGVWKGFFKSLISLFGWVVSIVLAILLARLVADFLLDITIISRLVLGGYGYTGWSLASTIEGWIPQGLHGVPAHYAGNEELIREAMGYGILGVLITPLIPMLTGTVAAESGLTVSQLMSMTLANHIFVLFVIIALIIVFRVIMIIFTKIANAMRKNKKLKSADRLGGFFIGAAKHGLYVFIIFFALSYFISSSFMTPFRNQLDQTSIMRPVSNGAFLVVDRYFRGDDSFLQRILDITGFSNGNNDEPEGPPNTNYPEYDAPYYSIDIDIQSLTVQVFV